MGCKIYSDVRGNLCKDCGGSFTKYQSIKQKKEEISFPVCNQCNTAPEKFRIRAKLKDEYGKSRYVFIRKNLADEPLNSIMDVLGVLGKIHIDLESGKFRHTEYDKKKVQSAHLFKNVVAAYLAYHEPRVTRKELSPYSMESKKKYSKILVNGLGKAKGFAEVSIQDIEAHHIEDFRNALESHSNQRMCLGEMKAILNWAKERYKLLSVPKILVPSSKKRKVIPDLNITRDKIIPAIDNEIHREAIRMLEQYGIRPSEVRAIQYEQIDLVNNRIIIDRHFSKTTLLKGRKSAGEGDSTSSLERPLTPELEFFIRSRPIPLDKKTFLFRNSVGKPLGVKDLSQSWRETLKKLKLPHVELYGLRGARVTEVIGKQGLHKAMDFAGHTNIKTTMIYNHSDRNVDDCFG